MIILLVLIFDVVNHCEKGAEWKKSKKLISEKIMKLCQAVNDKIMSQDNIKKKIEANWPKLLSNLCLFQCTTVVEEKCL